MPSTFVASDAPTRTEEQFGGLTDIVDLTIGPEEGVAGQSADLSLIRILEAAGEIPARGTAPGTEPSTVPATSPLREERAEVTQMEEPAPSTAPIMQAVAVLSGALCVSPDSTVPYEREQTSFRLWWSVREMEAATLENYFRLHGYSAYVEAEGVIKAFYGTTRITEISESRFQQILTERQLADEAAVAQAAEAEKEAAEEEEEDEDEEDEDEDGAEGGNNDHHPNDDDMHEGGGAMIIPSSDSEGEHSHLRLNSDFLQKKCSTRAQKSQGFFVETDV